MLRVALYYHNKRENTMKYLHFLLGLILTVSFCSCGSDSNDDAVGGDTHEELVIAAEGGNSSVAVRVTGDWISSTLDNWLSVSPATGNGGSVTISAKANESFAERTGTVTVRAGQNRQIIDVTQQGAERPAITCPLADGDKYQLVWHDEFDGDELSSDWVHEVKGDHWVNNELQNYVNHTSPNGKEVTSVKNGVLSINCFKEGGKVYSGRIYAKPSKGWRYGYIEASINLPTGKGTWPAFWMMPVNFHSWPADGEIDIMEEVGADPNRVSSSLHANAHVHSNNTQVTHEMYCAGAEGSYHLYAIEWTPDYIQTYVDGKKQLYYANRGLGKDDWPYDAAFYVILNLAWGGDWGGYKGVDESALPVSLKVDYVRVFQKK